jgi:hypothetical protein
MLEILQHALGLDRYGCGSGYRNHFVTGPGTPDFEQCRELAAQGLMEDHGVHPMCGGSHLFTVTEAGRRYVRDHSRKPPKLTRSQRRYRDYLAADSGLSFREWLSVGA